MELNVALDRVRKLIAKAEHENTDPVEAQTFRAMADKIMTKFAIDEAELGKTRTAALRPKPGKISIALTGDQDMLGYVVDLASNLARHCRCQIRHYTAWVDGAWTSTLYGFESDLRYFEIMYTTLRLHMIGVLRPEIDRSKSLEENSYTLHNSGLNWAEIGAMYGWYKVSGHEPGERPQDQIYRNDKGERLSYWDMAGMYKKACTRAARSRGETRLKVTSTESFRMSAASGYTRRLRQRINETEAGRGGAELILRSRLDDVSQFFRAENPDLFAERKPVPECEACKKAKSGACRAHPRLRYRTVAYSAQGYEAGVRHANAASLNPQATASDKRSIS